MSQIQPLNSMSLTTGKLDALKEQNRYVEERKMNNRNGPFSTFDGKEVLDLATTNYLGFAAHPRLTKASNEAAARYGNGYTSVRWMTGTPELINELETAIAAHTSTPAALTFGSGTEANSGAIPALVPNDKKPVIISDEFSHITLVNGIKLSGARHLMYQHNDMNSLEDKLKQARAEGSLWSMVATDAVFTVWGDVAPLPEIVQLAHQYGAAVYADDAHGTGVMGNGRGTIAHFGLQNDPNIIQMGTMSKAIGAKGGFVAGTQELRKVLFNLAIPIRVSAPLTPPTAGACLATLTLIQKEPQHLQQLWENTSYFRTQLQNLGFNTGKSETPIIPVMVGSADIARECSRRLYENGINTAPIAFPSVPEGKNLIRTAVTAMHTPDHLARALEAFAKVGKELQVI